MRIKLKQAFDLQMGKTPARNNMEFWGGTHKWISIADLGNAGKYIDSTKESISDEGVEASGIKIVPKGTVVMSFKLSIGKTAITSEDMYTNEAIIAFNNNGAYEIAADYLYHFCCGTNWGAGTNKAVMGLTLNKATLSEYEIEVPDISEQREIAKKLDGVDTLIEKHRAQLTALDELVKSRFIELFREYPSVQTLADVATITGGLTKNAKRDKLGLRKPYLRVANVSFASIDTTEMLDIGLTREEYAKTLLKNGDLLFVEGNGSPDQIGRVAIWNGEIEDCVHQNHLIKARFDLKRMSPVFAMYYFISERGRSQIKKKAVSTSGLYTLSVSKIADFEIPNPPLELQQQFAAFVAQVDKSKLAVQKSLQELETLKKSLMQKYFG